MNTLNKILLAIILLLFITIISFSIYHAISGGRLSNRYHIERFEANEANEANEAKTKGIALGGGFNTLLNDASGLMKKYNLSGDNIELFNNLSKGALSSAQIDKLIQTGKLNSKLMDTFLVILNDKDENKTPEESPTKANVPFSPNQKPAVIEGFSDQTTGQFFPADL